jgi:dienelactone hydrolase
MSLRKQFLFTFIAAIIAATAHAEIIELNVPNISYVQFQSIDILNPGELLTISGQLRIPVINEEEPIYQQGVPAVLVLHGSAGVDSRGEFYIEALNDAGIATLEIDMWAARGLTGGDRPAFPTLTVPDAFGALKYLSEIPNIDVERIAVLGFSWGGVVTMLAASQSYADIYGNGLAFAAHVAHYPVCWAYNKVLPSPFPPPIAPVGLEFGDLTNPLLIQIGDLDDYDERGDQCQNLIASLSEEDQSIASVIVYPNSYHAWDRLQPPITVFDPFSHLGMGGYVDIVPNPGKAFQSRSKAVQFLLESFGLEY